MSGSWMRRTSCGKATYPCLLGYSRPVCHNRTRVSYAEKRLPYSLMTIPWRQLGSLDLQVPVLSFGGAPVGRLANVQQAAPVIQHAYEQGIRFLDTAPLYGAGRSETYIGHVLKDKPRNSFALATKVGRLITQFGVDVQFDFSEAGIQRSVEASLARLQLEAVDILHIHDPDNHVEIAATEAYAALDRLRSQGVIKGIGIGMNRWELGQELMKHGRYDCFLLAGRYSLLHQDGLEFINRCQGEGIGIILGGVYNSGILAMGNVPQATYAYRLAPTDIRTRVSAIEDVCQEFSVPLQAASLQFALMHPGVSCAVIGAEETAQIDANLSNLDVTIPTEFWERMITLGHLDERVPIDG